jgi:hypothetical protein
MNKQAWERIRACRSLSGESEPIVEGEAVDERKKLRVTQNKKPILQWAFARFMERCWILK